MKTENEVQGGQEKEPICPQVVYTDSDAIMNVLKEGHNKAIQEAIDKLKQLLKKNFDTNTEQYYSPLLEKELEKLKKS